MVLIVPHAVTDGRRLHEAEVHTLNRGIGDGYRCQGCAAALVGLGVGEASQVARVRVDDAHAVGALGKTSELVVSVGIGHGGDGLAILVEDGVAVSIEQSDGHAREAVFGIALGVACIGVTEECSTDVEAALEGSRGFVVRRVVTGLILVGDACNVRDERACTFTGDLHGDLHGLYVALGNGLFGQIPFAGCRIVGAIAFSLDELNARGELIGGLDTGCCTRTVVGDGQGVGDDLTGSELEGCLVDFSGIGDRLLDGGVSQTGECPVLRVIGHRTATKCDIRGQGERLVRRCLHVAGRRVALSNAIRAGCHQRIAIHGDGVVTGGQILEGVPTICISGGRQRLFNTCRGLESQLDNDTCQLLVVLRGIETASVVYIPEDGVTDVAASDQTEIDAHVFLTLSQSDLRCRTVGVLIRVSTCVRHSSPV